MRITINFSSKFKIQLINSFTLTLITLMLCLWSGVAVGKAKIAHTNIKLKNVLIEKLPGDNVKFVLNFSDLPRTPKTFTIDDPPELVLDFPNTVNELPRDKMFQKLSFNLADSILVANNDNKVRVVITLNDSFPYSSEIDGNNLILIIKNEETQPLASLEESTISALDFHRGKNGEGKLVLDVKSKDVTTNVKDLDKNNMLIEFKNATIPNNLLRKFEVGDFGTPVKNIVITKKSKNILVKISYSDEYDKISYHVDGKYIVEVRPKAFSEQQSDKPRKFKFTGEKISLNFQDIEVRAVLQLLADFTGLNIIANDSVIGNVTLRLDSIPWDQALDFILKSKGLAKRESGNILLIAPSEELARYEEVEATSLKQLEVLSPLKTELLPVNYAKAEDIASIVKGNEKNSMLSSRGTISVDSRTNSILLKDIDEKINDIKDLIKNLDTPVKQVLIEAYIVNASQDFQDNLGIRLSGAAAAKIGKYRMGFAPRPGDGASSSSSGSSGTSGSSGSSGSSGTSGSSGSSSSSSSSSSTASTGDASSNASSIIKEGISKAVSGKFFDFAAGGAGVLGIALGNLPGGTLLSLELDAAEIESLTTIISKPRILTMDKQSATIESGKDIPYVTTTSNNGSTTTFQKAVLKLQVTPQITPNDQISMDLNITNDSPASSLNGSSSPPINTTSLKTNVLVSNGETIVLGGIFTDTILDSKAKIPYLSDLPIVGKLFQNKKLSDTKSELLVFITPKIVETLNYN